MQVAIENDAAPYGGIYALRCYLIVVRVLSYVKVEKTL